MKQVIYKNLVLLKGSKALELWENWQNAKANRNAEQAKLDQHIKDVESTTFDLLVHNPIKKEEVAFREPQEILDEMKALDE